MAMEVRPVGSIKAGGRVRQDLGDLEKLVESIKANGGLLQPILIRSDGRLIAGSRRLAACKLADRDMIEVNVRDDLTSVVALLIAERDENICRKDFNPSEMVEMGRRLEELERPNAREAQVSAGRDHGRGIASDESTEPNSPRDRHKNTTRAKVSEALGVSGYKYDHAKKVVEAAETGDPVAEEAVEEMDATGKVEPAYRKVTGQDTRPAPKPFDLSNERNQQRAAKQLERLWNVVNALAGAEMGLADFDLSPALAALSDEDAKEMDRMLGASAKAFSRLRSEIKSQKGL